MSPKVRKWFLDYWQPIAGALALYAGIVAGGVEMRSQIVQVAQALEHHEAMPRHAGSQQASEDVAKDIAVLQRDVAELGENAKALDTRQRQILTILSRIETKLEDDE